MKIQSSKGGYIQPSMDNNSQFKKTGENSEISFFDFIISYISTPTLRDNLNTILRSPSESESNLDGTEYQTLAKKLIGLISEETPEDLSNLFPLKAENIEASSIAKNIESIVKSFNFTENLGIEHPAIKEVIAEKLKQFSPEEIKSISIKAEEKDVKIPIEKSKITETIKELVKLADAYQKPNNQLKPINSTTFIPLPDSPVDKSTVEAIKLQPVSESVDIADTIKIKPETNLVTNNKINPILSKDFIETKVGINFEDKTNLTEEQIGKNVNPSKISNTSNGTIEKSQSDINLKQEISAKSEKNPIIPNVIADKTTIIENDAVIPKNVTEISPKQEQIGKNVNSSKISNTSNGTIEKSQSDINLKSNVSENGKISKDSVETIESSSTSQTILQIEKVKDNISGRLNTNTEKPIQNVSLKDNLNKNNPDSNQDADNFEYHKEQTNTKEQIYSKPSGYMDEIKTFNNEVKPTKFVSFTNVKLEDVPQYVEKMTKVLKNGETYKATMQLKPENLGSIFVNLTMKDDVLNIVIRANTTQTIEKIDSSTFQLKEALISQGFKSENIILKVENNSPLEQNYTTQYFDEKNGKHDDKKEWREFLNIIKNNSMIEDKKQQQEVVV